MQIFILASRRRHTRSLCDWSADGCSSDIDAAGNHADAAGELGDNNEGKSAL